MKKFISLRHCLSLITLFVGLATFAAPQSQTVTLHFDESMFKIGCSGNVIENIQYLNGAASLPADTCLPALPSVSVIVGGPAASVCDFSYRIIDKHLIFEDVDLPAAPKIVSSAELRKRSAGVAPRIYRGSNYPAEVIKYRTRSPWADATDFHFGCTPFIYDAASRSLYLIDEIELTLNYSDAPAAKLSAATAHTLTPRPSFLKAPLGKYGYNPLDSLKKPFLPIDTPIVIGPVIPPGPAESIETPRNEYVIITSEALKPAFEKLAKWKQIKGIDPLIQTVEYINKNVKGKDLPAKIKNYLRSVPSLYERPNFCSTPIKYVLLGGGATTIPPRYCAGNQNSKELEDRTIPTDLYFACLNDPYDWDMNGNGIYGEEEDSICMNPSFAVTRVPVETIEDAENFITKVIKYERSPKWTKRMLFGGCQMGKTSTYHYEAKGLATAIGWDWLGKELDQCKNEIHFLYDTINSFGYTDRYIFELPKIQTALSKGYNFIDIMTHGNQTLWFTEDGILNYDYSHAIDQTNTKAHSIITTLNVCFSSAFDGAINKSKPCIGAGFISGPNNGVVGYLGTSRSGYFYDGPSACGESTSYEYDFYGELFGTDRLENNRENKFGPIVSYIKYERIGDSNYWNEQRWLQYSINPFGDPEMQIFTDRPTNIGSVNVHIDSTTVNINADTGSTICVTGIGANCSYVRRIGTNSLTATNLPEKFSICITKPGCRPWHNVYQRLADGTTQELSVSSVEQIFDENMGLRDQSAGEIVDIRVGDNYNTITITTAVNPTNSANLYISNQSGRYHDLQEIIPGYRTKTIDISNISQGDLITFSLYVDGHMVDSKKLFKK